MSQLAGTNSSTSCRPTRPRNRSRDARRRSSRSPSKLSGELVKTENWGRRKLAYEIGTTRKASTSSRSIKGGGELMKELDRRLKVIDQVIRHLIVRVDEEQRVVERTRTRRTDVRSAGASRAGCRRVRTGERRRADRRRRRRRRTRRRRRFSHAIGARKSEAAAAAAAPASSARRQGHGSAGRCSAAARSASSARTRSTTSTTRT